MPILLGKVSTLLEWADELLNKKWDSEWRWFMDGVDTPYTVMTTRAPVVLIKHPPFSFVAKNVAIYPFFLGKKEISLYILLSIFDKI